MWNLLLHDDGEDVVEYALLAAIIGVAGVLVFPGIVSKLAGALSVAPINDLWVPGPPA